MRVIFALVFSIFAINANAGFTAVVIAYGSGDVPVNSSIDVEAEYVAISVSISSDEKYPAERAKLINKLQSAIKSETSKTDDIDYQQGVVSLSPREKSSFSFSKSYGRSSGSSFYLLSKLSKGKDVFAATQDIYKLIESVKKPDDTSISLGNTTLAISSPDKYRTELLRKIKSEVESTKKEIGTSFKVTITGLENPVIVRQKNDKQVTLFIDYRLEFAE